MTKVKCNISNMVDSLECRICKNELETQKHVYEYETLWKKRKLNREYELAYERIVDGTVVEQAIVAKLFYENMEILSHYPGDSNCLSAVSLL